MPPRDDSDSSGDEDQDYTETNVLLGFVSVDSKGEEISRLGGRPEWLDPTSPPSPSLARCRVCHDFMALLLQLNVELPERFPGHERRLYVLSCRRKACRRREGSVRALRGLRFSKDAAGLAVFKEEDPKQAAEETRRSEEAGVPSPTPRLGEMLFGVARPAATATGNPFRSSPGNPLGSASKAGAGGGRNPFSTTAIAASEVSPSVQGGMATSSARTTGPSTSKSPSDEPEGATTEAATLKSATASTDGLPKTFAEVLSLNKTSTTTTPAARREPHEPWPTDMSTLPAPYPIRWLSEVEYEILDATPSSLPASVVTDMAAMDDDGTGGGTGSGKSGKEDKEVFESAMDSAFQRFADRVGQNPEQTVRYEFGGAPLLYSRDDAVGRQLHRRDGEHHGGTDNKNSKNGGHNKKVTTVTVSEVPALGAEASSGIPRCGNCGAARVFEAQLMPHAIEELESGDGVDEGKDRASATAAAGLEGMDWGTIIVGVCERDCMERGKGEGDTGYVEEWVGVQWEELAMRR